MSIAWEASEVWTSHQLWTQPWHERIGDKRQFNNYLINVVKKESWSTFICELRGAKPLSLQVLTWRGAIQGYGGRCAPSALFKVMIRQPFFRHHARRHSLTLLLCFFYKAWPTDPIGSSQEPRLHATIAIWGSISSAQLCCCSVCI